MLYCGKMPDFYEVPFHSSFISYLTTIITLTTQWNTVTLYAAWYGYWIIAVKLITSLPFTLKSKAKGKDETRPLKNIKLIIKVRYIKTGKAIIIMLLSVLWYNWWSVLWNRWCFEKDLIATLPEIILFLLYFFTIHISYKKGTRNVKWIHLTRNLHGNGVTFAESSSRLNNT